MEFGHNKRAYVNYKKLLFQQLIAITKPLESVQNAILRSIAILEENQLEEDPTYVAIQVLEIGMFLKIIYLCGEGHWGYYA